MSAAQIALAFLRARVGKRKGSTGADVPAAIPPSLGRRALKIAERLAGDGHLGRVEVNGWRFGIIPRLQPDPLRRAAAGASLEAIRIFIPMHEKDSWMAHLAVAGLCSRSDHPIDSITVCMPDGLEPPRWMSGYPIEVTRDSEVLRTVFSGGESEYPSSGYLRQMTLKLIAAASADVPTLIQCSDTALLRPRVWIFEGRQTLPVHRKSPQMFHRHSATFLGVPAAVRQSSTTTHHQLMQPGLVQELFGRGEGMMPRLTEWYEIREHEAPCEYQVYGSHLRLSRPEGWVPASWHHHNSTVAWNDMRRLPELSRDEAEEVLDHLREENGHLFGFSLHVRS